MGKEPRKKQRYETLYEAIESKMQLVVEGHSTLVGEIQGLRQEVRTMEKQLGFVENAVTDTNARLTETNKHLEMLVNRFDIHEKAHAS